MFTSSDPIAVTIDSSLHDMLPGQRIDFMSGNDGVVTFDVDDDAVVVSTAGAAPLDLRTTLSAASLVCIQEDTYVLVGDVVA